MAILFAGTTALPMTVRVRPRSNTRHGVSIEAEIRIRAPTFSIGAAPAVFCCISSSKHG